MAGLLADMGRLTPTHGTPGPSIPDLHTPVAISGGTGTPKYCLLVFARSASGSASGGIL